MEFKILLIFVIVLIAISVLDLAYKDSFYKSSVESIKNIQQNSSHAKTEFFKLMNYVGDQGTFFIILMLMFNF